MAKISLLVLRPPFFETITHSPGSFVKSYFLPHFATCSWVLLPATKQPYRATSLVKTFKHRCERKSSSPFFLATKPFTDIPIKRTTLMLIFSNVANHKAFVATYLFPGIEDILRIKDAVYFFKKFIHRLTIHSLKIRTPDQPVVMFPCY